MAKEVFLTDEYSLECTAVINNKKIDFTVIIDESETATKKGFNYAELEELVAAADKARKDDNDEVQSKDMPEFLRYLVSTAVCGVSDNIRLKAGSPPMNGEDFRAYLLESGKYAATSMCYAIYLAFIQQRKETLDIMQGKKKAFR